MKTYLLLVTISIISLIIIWGCTRKAEENNYKQLASEDEEMNAAIEKAKASSDEFFKSLHINKPDTKNYFVKRPFNTPSGTEHLWIEVIEEKEGMIKGYVANEPEETQEVKVGQIVLFNKSEISDWRYQDGNKLIGGFTIRYFVEKMSPSERESFLREAGFEL